MNDEDRMMDIASNKLPKALTQIAVGIMLFILKPGAAATDPFFRKNLGERYFSPLLAMLSLAVWSVLLWAAITLQTEYFGRSTKTVQDTGIFILLAYAFLAWRNIRAARKRLMDGVRWHSRSYGESLFGSENPIRDFVIEVIVAFFLFIVSPIFGGYFIFSRYQSYLSKWLGIAQRYNRYLDAVDAKIESEFLEKALRDGFPASETAGIYEPLPRHLKGELRANVARVAAGIPISGGGVTSQPPFAPTTAGAAEPKPSTPTDSPRTAPVEPGRQTPHDSGHAFHRGNRRLSGRLRAGPGARY